MRNLQEQAKKAFCYQNLFWPFTVWIKCSSDLKNFANSQSSASNFKHFSWSLGQFFLSVSEQFWKQNTNYDQWCDLLMWPCKQIKTGLIFIRQQVAKIIDTHVICFLLQFMKPDPEWYSLVFYKIIISSTERKLKNTFK